MKEHLAHFDIAGFTYYDGVLAFKKLEIGTKLTLKLEDDNKYDTRAVAIYYKEFKLGFVPRKENRIFYKLLKVGLCPFEARVQRLDKKAIPEHQVGIIIHLVNQLTQEIELEEEPTTI
jgi:hypothetical protein